MNDQEKYVDISKLDRAEVLMALFNRSKLQGLGVLCRSGEVGMTADDAREILASGERYFDYLRGRVMKVDLDEDMLFVGLYDRDNGQGAARAAIAACKEIGGDGNDERAQAEEKGNG